MMKIFQTLFIAGTLLISTASFAQKVRWETGGDLAFLKGEKEMGVQYDYANITVKGQGEQPFLEEQKTDMNKDKEGAGDTYVTEWMEARTNKYQPGFEKGINKALKDDDVVIKQGGTPKYTILLHTYDIDMGKGKMFTKQPAYINYIIEIVETSDPSHVVAKGVLEDVEGEINAPKGMGFMPGGGVVTMSANIVNRDYSNRLAKSYNKAGEILGKTIHKTIQ